MQVNNVNLPITVTGRHVTVTDAMREYAVKKVENLHLDFPKIIDAKVILDVEKKNRQIAEIVLYCTHSITIEVSSVTEDIYASIDESISKIARRMRKYKTRFLKASHRPREGSIKHLEEVVYTEDQVLEEATSNEPIEPFLIHKENFKVKPLYPDEAIMDLELGELPFVLFNNAQTNRLAIVFRRKDGEYGMVEPPAN